MRRIFYTNRLMDRLEKFSGFQKLLFFFIPIFIFVALYSFFFMSGWAFPDWLKQLVVTVLLWLLGASWAYLLIGAQVHWKTETRNLAINIILILLAATLVFLHVLD